MKKLALVFAVLLIAAFYVTPVTASDFSAGGAYRALAISEDPGGGDETAKYFRQRYRLAFKWAVNDNVSAQLRGDFAEMTWGDGYRPEQGTDTLMIDRAFVNIKKGPMNLTVGQQANGWGLGTLWSDQFQGVHLGLEFAPVTVNLLYVKESEGGVDGNVTTDDNENDDRDTYGVSVLYGNDMFSGGISWAMRDTASDAGVAVDYEQSGIAIHATGKLGPVDLGGEFTWFDGDQGTPNSDYKGTQFHITADMAFNQSWSGGLVFLWADDVDSNETQITSITDDLAFHPLDFDGALAWDRGAYGGGTSIFDVSGNGNGAIGIIGRIGFAATETLMLYAKAGYVEPNEDDAVLDSNFYGLANFDWTWMPSVTVSGGIGYVAPDLVDGSANDDPIVELLLRLGVSF